MTLPTPQPPVINKDYVSKWLLSKLNSKSLVRTRNEIRHLLPRNLLVANQNQCVLSPFTHLTWVPLSSPEPRTPLPGCAEDTVQRTTHLPDLLNSIGEDVDDDKPLLHAGLGLHLHQHCVSEQHEECQISHLWGTHIPWTWAQVTTKDVKQGQTEPRRSTDMNFYMTTWKYHSDYFW